MTEDTQGPLPEFPPPTHGLWARDQLFALCVGSCAKRCGAASPSRQLSQSLLRCEIGGRWVTRTEARVALSVAVRGPDYFDVRYGAEDQVQMCANVGVSHTGGVVDLWTLCIPRSMMTVSGWLSQCAVVCEDFPKWYFYDIENGCQLPGALPSSTFALQWKFKRGLKWAIMYVKGGGNKLVLWPVGDIGKISTIDMPFRKTLVWVDFQDEDRSDDGVMAAVRCGRHAEVWCVDLQETFQTGQLVVKRKCKGYNKRNVRRMVLLSGTDTLIMASGKPLRNTDDQYVLSALTPRTPKSIHECMSKPHKVDSRHFAVFNSSTDDLMVFSTGDFEAPSRVFHVKAGTRFKFGCGFVLFCDPVDRHLDLCDERATQQTLLFGDAKSHRPLVVASTSSFQIFYYLQTLRDVEILML